MQMQFQRLLLLYVAAITVAEVVTTLASPVAGVVLHILTLGALIVNSAHRAEPGQRRLLLSMVLVPLTRVLSMSMPLSPIAQIYWYPMIYAPLLVATIIVARVVNYSAKDINFAPGKAYLIPIIALLGLVLGVMENYILRPASLVGGLSFSQVAIPALLLLISTGLVEELVFRGVLQTAAMEVMGGWGVYYVSFLFAILHIGFLSAADFLLVFAVALFFAWIVIKTRSLLGVILAHGLTNITLYLIAPFVIRW